MMASDQWSVHVNGCGLQETYGNGMSLQKDAEIRDYDPTMLILRKRSCGKFSTCVTVRRGQNAIVVIVARRLSTGSMDCTLQSKVNIVSLDGLLKLRASNLLLPFIILQTSNFMREHYFPGEEIILQLSILIFSLEHSSVCCLFKTKLSKCLPSLSKAGDERQLRNRQLKNCGISATPDRGKDEHKTNLYPSRECEGTESSRMFQRTYHQQRYSVCPSQQWNGHMQKPHKSLLEKLLRFSPKRPVTYLFALLLMTSVFPPTMSTTWPAPECETESLRLNVPDGLRHCSHYGVESLLNPGGSSGDCDRTCVEKSGDAGEREVEQFERVVDKYATASTYSAQWSMQSCKVAYKDWIWSQHHEVFRVGSDGAKVKIDPCSRICRYVESSCPFFRVYNETKLYGGQPTFLCNGVGQKDLKNGTTRKECYYVHPPPQANSNCPAATDLGFGIPRNGSVATCRPSDEVPRTLRFRSCTASSGSYSLNWRFNYLPCDVRLLLYLFLFKIQDLIKIA